MLSITLLAVLISVAVTVLVSRSIGRELGAEPSEVRAVVQAIQQGGAKTLLGQVGQTATGMAAQTVGAMVPRLPALLPGQTPGFAG
eukprot:gene39375-53231_t